MIHSSQYRNLLLALPGPLLSGLTIYLIFSSYLLVPLRITVPISIIMSTLIFGLTNYYNSFEKSSAGAAVAATAATTTATTTTSSKSQQAQNTEREREMNQKK